MSLRDIIRFKDISFRIRESALCAYDIMET
jgi:hypothetical protein